MNTNTNLRHLLILIILLAGPLPHRASASETPQVGPNGGRILPGSPTAEFWITPERKIQITFLDSDYQPIPLSRQTARATAQLPGERLTLAFEPHENILLTTSPLPETDGYTIVVQLRSTPESRPSNHRIFFEDHLCSGCKLIEYALGQSCLRGCLIATSPAPVTTAR